MKLIKKTIYYLKKQGIGTTAKLILIYLWDIIRMVFFRAVASIVVPCRQGELNKLLGGKRVFVFTPSVEWNYLYQRAQQMSCQYAQKPNTAVVFLTTQRHYDNVLGFSQIKPNVILMNVNQAKILNKLSPKVTQKVACIYNITSGVDCLSSFEPDKIVYEYVDDLHFIVSKADNFEFYEKLHKDFLVRADIAIATATALYNEIEPIATNPLLLPNAGDYEHFAKVVEPNANLAKMLQDSKCVLGYYGALASWFDYQVVKQSAVNHPEWTWLLIGKVIGDDLNNSGIKDIPNIICVPSVPYKSLPDYIALCDILTIPFVINETTLATSPVKLFEYMAAGKGIITSDIPECRKYKSVAIYRNLQEFESLVPEILGKSNDGQFLSLLKKEALENTWSSRTDTVIQMLDKTN